VDIERVTGLVVFGDAGDAGDGGGVGGVVSGEFGSLFFSILDLSFKYIIKYTILIIMSIAIIEK